MRQETPETQETLQKRGGAKTSREEIIREMGLQKMGGSPEMQGRVSKKQNYEKEFRSGRDREGFLRQRKTT
jgi:hypothetical protein